MGEWPHVQLGDVADLLAGFPFASAEFTDDPADLRLLRGDNVGQGALRWHGAKRWPTRQAEGLEAYKLRVDDVILAMDRPWIEAGLKFAAVQPNDLPALLVQRVSRIRGGPRLATRYLKYVIASRPFTEYILSVQTGTTVPHISAKQILSYRFPLPPLAEQHRIAGILGALDDRIELNRQTSETLGAMAGALFRSWFVDFDPVRAKAEGREPGLPPHLADLFPDCLVDSELGEIPKGWAAGRVGDEFNLTMGQSPPASTYNEVGEGLPFYQGRADFGPRYPRLRVYCSAPSRFAKVGDTLVSVRAPVGDLNIARLPCAVGRGVAAVRHKSNSVTYTFEAMRSLSGEFGKFESHGTVFGSISRDGFERLPIVVPPIEAVERFESLAQPLEARLGSLAIETSRLSEARDALLPRLLSGGVAMDGPP